MADPFSAATPLSGEEGSYKFVITGLTLGGAAGGGAGSGALLEKHIFILLILRLLAPQKHCLKIRLLNADHHAILIRDEFHQAEVTDWETFC
tara:strand:+ start:3791 stop:4066 length:276 start_codon:yes stop_codon:yes gene_type:complete